MTPLNRTPSPDPPTAAPEASRAAALPVVHVLPYLAAAYGGPVVAAAGMLVGLAEHGVATTLVGVATTGDDPPYDGLPAPIEFRDARFGGLRYSRRLWAWLRTEPAALFHVHGMWTDVHRAVAATARHRGLPMVVGPCGMLEPNALNRSAAKKRLALLAFQRRALHEAKALIANSPHEIDHLRTFGLRNPVALIPNPVVAPASDVLPDGSTMDAAPRRHQVLFLGRIHPVKGIERLLDAWCSLRDFHDEWVLIVAGPDECGMRAGLEHDLAARGCADAVRFVGPLRDTVKWASLRAADLLVMPSDYENFGMSAAEALIAGTPVIATDRTPWHALPREKAGWCVPPTSEALAAALREAASLTDAERHAMSANARNLAASFTPERIGGQLHALYAWVLGRGEKPDFVDCATRQY